MKSERINGNIWIPKYTYPPARLGIEPDWQTRKQISVTLDPACEIGSDKNFQPTR